MRIVQKRTFYGELIFVLMFDLKLFYAYKEFCMAPYQAGKAILYTMKNVLDLRLDQFPDTFLEKNNDPACDRAVRPDGIVISESTLREDTHCPKKLGGFLFQQILFRKKFCCPLRNGGKLFCKILSL
jgi:hypothetical protein